MSDDFPTHPACREHLGDAGWCPEPRDGDGPHCTAHANDRADWAARMLRDRMNLLSTEAAR